jgi:hypothetical protein
MNKIVTVTVQSSSEYLPEHVAEKTIISWIFTNNLSRSDTQVDYVFS